MNQEALRQQQLVAALWRRGDAGAVALCGTTARIERGLRAYRGNAGAAAERSLAGVYPTLRALLGEPSFAALARAHWNAEPPARGDLAWFGAALPASIEGDAQRADVAYLADVARLEWALHVAESAADVAFDGGSLTLLADADPAALTIRLAPGSAVIASRWPIVALWQAHRPGGKAALAREALAAGAAETALVWRDGWRADCRAVDPPTAAFVIALCTGRDLAAALDVAGAGFDFAGWLAEALQQRRIERVALSQPTLEIA